MNHNHANYQARLDFVANLLREQFKLEVRWLDAGSGHHMCRSVDLYLVSQSPHIVPIQYDPESPFKYNNFAYRVTSPSAISASHATKTSPLRPGCVPIPEGTHELVIRLANADAEGISMTDRIENEVAIMSLASAALSAFQPHIVPRVYGWGSAAGDSAQGWIAQELMPGSPLDGAFEAMGLEEKRKVFSQMAAILEALQSYKLPESITGFGGVTFDVAGRIVSAEMPTVGAGPWDSYDASFKGRLEAALRKADQNPYIKGWRANDLRERLDRLIAEGMPAQFEALGGKEESVIVHADFSRPLNHARLV
jgi:hypothetical protein